MTREWKVGEICKHDVLGRKCDLCDYEERIAELERQLAHANDTPAVLYLMYEEKLREATRRAEAADRLLDDIANRRIGRETCVPDRIILSRVERAAHEYFNPPAAIERAKGGNDGR